MFGYVRPALAHLGETERRDFGAAYCGLCHALGRRYGLAGRVILNYDLVFLSMLLSHDAPAACQKRCIVHPVKGCACACGGGAFDTAADMSVILTWWQLRDGVGDSAFWKGLIYRAASLLLRRAYRKARARQPAFDASTARQLTELHALEQAGEPSLDAPADTFARLLSGAAAGECEPARRRVLEQMLYHLGRWIYLVDAADDLKKDVRSGSYNPLPLRFSLTGGALLPQQKQELAATLDSSVRMMAAAFELADFGAYGAIIESTVYQGLYAVGGAVLDGTFRKKTKPLRKKGGVHHG